MTNKSLTSTTTSSNGWNQNHKACFNSLVFNNGKNFQTFAGIIKHQLGEVAYGGLHYNSFRIIGFLYCKIVKLAAPDQALKKIGG
jgi:hypothetical protein